MGKTFHICVNVEHMAKLTKKEFDKVWKGVISDEKTGRKLTYEEVKVEFLEELKPGHNVYPFGNCDNFDYQHGCRGHEVEG